MSYPLSTIYFYLTSYCNLSCIHCWISPRYLKGREAPDETDLSRLKEIIDQAIPLGLKSIKLTGGEPFLSRHTLPLISYASDKKLKVVIETNGVLVDEGIAKFLKENNAGFVSVSLDGSTSEVHEAVRKERGSFDKAVTGIKNLKKYGINTQVIFSIYKKNALFLEDTISFSEKLGADSLKINCISMVSRGELLNKEGQTLAVKEYIDLNNKIEEELKTRYKIKIILDLPPAFKSLKNIKMEASTCGLKGIIGVLPDGKISICGIGEVLSSLVLGDIREETLERIWENNPLLSSIRQDLPRKLEGICGDCILKTLCLGKCRAEAYYRNNNIFSPFYFCEEANRLGLFPENRRLKTYKEASR
ncbi:MAG TPA: radical SAM protein [Candidatus Margulisiibacteriota bacterium]|nr:radical SAM protein [Candidatus Margulisiibacteriota bacterium]